MPAAKRLTSRSVLRLSSIASIEGADTDRHPPARRRPARPAGLSPWRGGRHRGDGPEAGARPALRGAAFARRRHASMSSASRRGRRARPISRGSSPIRRSLKIFHFARFDVALLRQALGIEVAPIWCTKIASRLARTYTDRHGLKDLAREVLGLEISKQQQIVRLGRRRSCRRRSSNMRPPTCSICTPSRMRWKRG